ncbi:MAG: hypothetical protein Q8R79_07840 [Legionellaceae bacterium]|nr:hypothetical protein [Legionellaceae bacterium]
MKATIKNSKNYELIEAVFTKLKERGLLGRLIASFDMNYTEGQTPKISMTDIYPVIATHPAQLTPDFLATLMLNQAAQAIGSPVR